MAYRDFAHPATVERSKSIEAWLTWMEEQGDALIPAAPRHPLSCTRCYGATGLRHDGGTWPTCWACRTYGDVVDTYVPITYSLDAGLESMLHRYKDRAVDWLRMPLASLVTVFASEHAACIDADARGIDIAITMPSNDRDRSFDHLDRLLRGVVVNDPVLGLFNWSSDVVARDHSIERPRRGQLRPEAYAVTHGVVSDAAVLVLDDTWTSGSSAASVAAALKGEGARHVTILTLGRQLNRENDYGSTDAIYQDRSVVPWSRESCILCA